jgi:hypothetical protein
MLSLAASHVLIGSYVDRIPLKNLLEAGLWIGFALFAFIYSFEFNKDIETYRFNATGWPRMVLVLIVLAALAHLFQIYRDSALQEVAGEGESDAGSDAASRTPGRRLRLLAMLTLPLVYAYLLAPVGFYVLTPIFIFLLLLLAEERRWRYLISVSLGIYAALVFVFGKLLYLSLPVGNVQIFYDFSNWLLTFIQ